LYDHNGTLYTLDQLSEHNNIRISPMAYNSLIHALPKAWKAIMKNADKPENVLTNNQICIQNKIYNIYELTSQQIYWNILEKIIKTPTSLDKWIDEFPFLNDTDFEHFFLLPNLTSRDTKLQTFQYKILNNIIPCRAKLFHWKISDTGLCQYCGSYDNLSHYLYFCETTRNFWNQLTNWVQNTVQFKIQLSVIDIIFGIKNTEDKLLLNINFFILHAKRYIYQRKIDNKDLFLLEFLNMLKQNVIIERNRYLIKGDYEQFENKWSHFTDIFIDHALDHNNLKKNM